MQNKSNHIPAPHIRVVSKQWNTTIDRPKVLLSNSSTGEALKEYIPSLKLRLLSVSIHGVKSGALVAISGEASNNPFNYFCTCFILVGSYHSILL